MSVNSVNSTQSPKKGAGFLSSLAQTGATAASGALTGAVVGGIAGVVKPVSKKQIAKELVDHFQMNDKTGVIKNAIEALSNPEMAKETAAPILEKADKLVKEFQENALGMVKETFSKARKLRTTANDELVKTAKKCAKSTQRSKYLGTAVYIGVLAALIGSLFKGVPNVKTLNETSTLQNKTALQTHQG